MVAFLSFADLTGLASGLSLLLVTDLRPALALKDKYEGQSMDEINIIYLTLSPGVIQIPILDSLHKNAPIGHSFESCNTE